LKVEVAVRKHPAASNQSGARSRSTNHETETPPLPRAHFGRRVAVILFKRQGHDFTFPITEINPGPASRTWPRHSPTTLPLEIGQAATALLINPVPSSSRLYQLVAVKE